MKWQKNRAEENKTHYVLSMYYPAEKLSLLFGTPISSGLTFFTFTFICYFTFPKTFDWFRV